jgi:hypothetical protein
VHTIFVDCVESVAGGVCAAWSSDTPADEHAHEVTNSIAHTNCEVHCDADIVVNRDSHTPHSDAGGDLHARNTIAGDRNSAHDNGVV